MDIVTRSIPNPEQPGASARIIELELPGAMPWRWSGLADETWEPLLRESLRGRGGPAEEAEAVVAAVRGKLAAS